MLYLQKRDTRLLWQFLHKLLARIEKKSKGRWRKKSGSKIPYLTFCRTIGYNFLYDISISKLFQKQRYKNLAWKSVATRTDYARGKIAFRSRQGGQTIRQVPLKSTKKKQTEIVCVRAFPCVRSPAGVCVRPPLPPLILLDNASVKSKIKIWTALLLTR